MAAFVDSNVLIYSMDRLEPAKRPVADDWLASLWRCGGGRLSTQVLNEFYWNATRTLEASVDRETARGVVRRYAVWVEAPIDPPLLTEAMRLEDRFQLAWWDALIVAAAQRANCRWLLTEDLQDGQSFDGVMVVDPFRHSPDEILGNDGAGQVAEAPVKRRRGRRARAGGMPPAV